MTLLYLYVIPFKVISIRSHTLLCMSFAGLEASCKSHFSGFQHKAEHIIDIVPYYLCMPLGWQMHVMKQWTPAHDYSICLQLGRMPTQQSRQLTSPMSSQQTLSKCGTSPFTVSVDRLDCKVVRLSLVPFGTLVQKYHISLVEIVPRQASRSTRSTLTLAIPQTSIPDMPSSNFSQNIWYWQVILSSSIQMLVLYFKSGHNCCLLYPVHFSIH